MSTGCPQATPNDTRNYFITRTVAEAFFDFTRYAPFCLTSARTFCETS